MNRKNKIYSGISIFLMMFLFAILENTRGVIIPQVRNEFGVNPAEISFMLTLSSLAFIVGTYAIGRVSEKIGQKKSILLAIIIMITACLILAFTPNYLIFLIAMMVFSVALSINGVVSNISISLLFTSSSSIILNSLHFMYGVGAMIGQKTTGILISSGLGFRKLYLYSIAFLVVLLIVVMLANYVDGEVHREEEHGAAQFMKNPLVFLFAFAIGFYVFAEQGLAVWLTDYLKTEYAIGENQASSYLAYFFLLLALGRLLGGFVVSKVGEFKTIITGVTIGFILVLVGVVMASKALILISLAGLFYSITYPTMVVLIGKTFRNRISYVTGLILTIASITNMTMNQIMGSLTSSFGYAKTVYLIPFSALVSLMFMFLLRREINQTKDRLRD